MTPIHLEFAGVLTRVSSTDEYYMCIGEKRLEVPIEVIQTQAANVKLFINNILHNVWPYLVTDISFLKGYLGIDVGKYIELVITNDEEYLAMYILANQGPIKDYYD